MRISLKITLDLGRKEPVEEVEEIEDYNDITAITEIASFDPDEASEIGFRLIWREPQLPLPVGEEAIAWVVNHPEVRSQTNA
jgi:hypothetical protein